MDIGFRRVGHVGMVLVGLVLAVLVVASAAQAEPHSPADGTPLVWSDKDDYAPGELVTLSGALWQPGEVVHLRVNDDHGSTWSRDVDVTADASGRITEQFNLPNWFVATYSVTATGASGAVVTMSFTDSSVALSFPTAGATYSRGQWDAGCGTPAGDLCGTAEGSNVAKVQISLKRNSDGSYWNGTTWAPISEQTSFQTVTWNERSGDWSSDFGSAKFSGSGAYTVIARILNKNDNEITGVTRTFTIQAKQNQTIDFTAPNGLAYGDADAALGATATSALPVSLDSSTPSVCTIVGGKLHILA